MAFDPKGQGERMAARWYERPQSGCDEATLACLLERVLREAYATGAQDERERQQRKILEWLFP